MNEFGLVNKFGIPQFETTTLENTNSKITKYEIDVLENKFEIITEFQNVFFCTKSANISRLKL